MEDLEALLLHLTNDYVKGRTLTQNIPFQLFRRHALKHYATLSQAAREVILQQLIKHLKDPHVRLESILTPSRSLERLYEDHFRSFYQPSVGMPTLHAVTFKNLEPQASVIDSDTLLWQIPSLHVGFMPRLEGLLAQYRQAMEQLPYWIIDLRGNGGGSDRIWSHFWPYLSSGSLLQGGTAFRASRGNQGYFTLAAHYAKLWGAHNDSLWYESVVKAMRSKEGTFVIPPLPGFSPEIHLQQPRPYPQRVAILIDNKTASSAETLVHLAKQSFKVIILGQSPSMGCTDSGNLRYAILPSKRYALSFGTSLELNSYHVAIDRGGYQPDIILPQGDASLVIPWAQAYLRNDLSQMRDIYTRFSRR